MKKVHKYINIVLLAAFASALFVSCGSAKSKYGCPEKLEVTAIR